MEINASPNNKDFVVVLRGSSAAVFPEGKNLIATNFPSSIGPVNIAYATRWLKRGGNISLPGHIWIEVSGAGIALENVLAPFANAGLALLPILSLCTNVAIGDPKVELGYDNSKGLIERDYFQTYIPPEGDNLRVFRYVNSPETTNAIRKLAKHTESERLRRGANQYRLALDSWHLGRETLALAHLWMALEAITKAKVRLECTARGLSSEQELADNLGIPIQKLDSVIRKDFILGGDAETYKKAKEASDGFEHGYLGYDELLSKSKGVRHKMAKYVRNSILQMMGLSNDTYQTLTSAPFDKPLGDWPVVKYLRGKLTGTKDKLALEANEYPIMKWNQTINTTSIESDGKINIVFNETFTPELGQGTTFQAETLEIWQAE